MTLNMRVSVVKKVLHKPIILCLCIFIFSFGQIRCQKKNLSMPVSVGIVKNDLSTLLLKCANQQQFFNSEGIQSLQMKQFENEKDLIGALKVGQIDGCAIHCDQLFRELSDNTFPCYIVSPLSVHGYLLLVGKESRYRELNTYEPLTVAVSQSPSLECYLVQKLLEDNSIPLERLKFVTTSYDQMSSLLLDQSVDFVMVSEPEASIILNNDDIHVFIHSSKIWFHHPNTVFVYSGQTLEKRQTLISPTLYALFETSDWMSREKHLFPALAAKLFHMEEHILDKAYHHFEFSAKFGFNGLKEFYEYMNPGASFDKLLEQSTYLTAQAHYISRKEAYYSSLKKKSDKEDSN